MARVALTAGSVRRGFLEPALDARAANLTQATLIFNPSPEEDSVLEELRSLRRPVPDLLALITRLSASNTREGRYELSITSASDRLATDLRDLELNGPAVGAARATLTGKGIARQLRAPLRVLADENSDALTDAVLQVAQLLRTVPTIMLLSTTVEHELGRERFELLQRLCASRAGDRGGGPILPTGRRRAKR